MPRAVSARWHDPMATTDDALVPDGVERLLQLLDIERLDRDLYRAPVQASGLPGPPGRLFGGQVAAQALRAAAFTVEAEHLPHSLHGYFLRPGNPEVPVLLHVERLRDGKSFTTRSVVAVQDGEAIFNLTASFHRDEPDGEYQMRAPDGVPDPDDDSFAWSENPLSRLAARSPIEMREVPTPPVADDGVIESARRTWMRTRGPIPDDRFLHACVITYLSDFGGVFAAALSVGGAFGTIMGASLDHAVWFHRSARADEWLLYDLRPLSSSGSRGLVHGALFSRDGVHVASVTQEALVRRIRRSETGA